LGERLHCRCLERFVVCHAGKNAGQATREHRLAGSRWPDHEQAVRARGGDLECALGVMLTAHLGEIGTVARGDLDVRHVWLEGSTAVQMRRYLEQAVRG